MSIFCPVGFWMSSTASFLVKQSIRFDGTSYLSKVNSVAGNMKTWVFSCTLKRGNISGATTVILGTGTGATDDFLFYFGGTEALNILSRDGGTQIALTTSRLFRDPSASYHVVLICNTPHITPASRLRLFINGVEETSFSASTYPSLNYDTLINSSGRVHYIGAGRDDAKLEFDGLISNVNFVGGYAPTDASDFGEFNANGKWIPKAFDSTAVTGLAPVLQSAGTAIGDLTDGSGLAALFNSNTAQASGASARSTSNATPGPYYGGKDWGSGVTKTVAGCAVYSPTDVDINNTPATFTFTLQGSTDNFSASIVDLGSLTELTAANSVHNITATVTTTAYRYHRLKLVSSQNDWMYVDEIEFSTISTGYGTNGFNIDGADANNLGKMTNVTGTDTAVVSASGEWTGNTANYTFTGDTIDPDTSNIAIDSVDTFTGDFTLTFTPDWPAINNCYIGVFAIDEDGTFNPNIENGGLPSMTNSFWVNYNEFKVGGSVEGTFTGSSTLEYVLERRGSKFSVYINGDHQYTSTAEYSGEVRMCCGAGTGAYVFASTSWVDDPIYVYRTSGLTSADQLLDTPTDDLTLGTANYCVMSPINTYLATLANANLDVHFTTYTNSSRGTIGIPVGRSSDLFVFECVMTAGTIAYGDIGVVDGGTPLITGDWRSYKSGSSWEGAGMCDGLNPTYGYGLSPKVASGFTYALNDVVGVEVNCVNGDVKYYKNGAYQFTNSAVVGITALTTDRDWFPACCMEGPSTGDWSFTFIEADMTYFANYAAGAKTICTANLPAPVIPDGSAHFGATTYTGDDGTSHAVTFGGNSELAADLIWIKNRGGANNHTLIDNVRGGSAYFESNNNAAEQAAAVVTSWNADGITVGTPSVQVNGSAYSYALWGWKAGGAPVSNTDGSITSSVSANVDAGFSIMTYTGSSVNATIGHGLTSAPEFWMVKARNQAWNWYCNHSSLLAINVMYLDLTNAAAVAPTAWNSTLPSSSVISLGTHDGSNQNTTTYVCYAWHSVPGYSKIGTYTGNGSADGPFVECGFRPSWIMVKRADGVANWSIFDNQRLGYNPANNILSADTSAAETTVTDWDFLSNGFKARTTGAGRNASGGTYIYMAFAENPFGGAGVAQGKAS